VLTEDGRVGVPAAAIRLQLQEQRLAHRGCRGEKENGCRGGGNGENAHDSDPHARLDGAEARRVTSRSPTSFAPPTKNAAGVAGGVRDNS
jgi:hypothetical protein